MTHDEQIEHVLTVAINEFEAANGTYTPEMVERLTQVMDEVLLKPEDSNAFEAMLSRLHANIQSEYH